MTKGPGSFSEQDIAPLMVLNEYLSTMEGPFWKQVRGNGLAYGASLRMAIEAGIKKSINII
jgi:Zn-dependent M16 (insulinase) family peptidase